MTSGGRSCKEKGLWWVVIIVFFMLLVACSSRDTSHYLTRPAWVDAPPMGHTVGVASYAVFGEPKARENAVLKAITSIALQKGSDVDVAGRVGKLSVVDMRDGVESFRETATIKVQANIKGRDVPVKAEIKAYWKDTRRMRIWVLMSEN